MADSDYGDLVNPNKVGGSDARRVAESELERLRTRLISALAEADLLREQLRDTRAALEVASKALVSEWPRDPAQALDRRVSIAASLDAALGAEPKPKTTITSEWLTKVAAECADDEDDPV